MEYSVNERAKLLMGTRMEGKENSVVFIDMPCELGYQCPVHKKEWDERLHWSEYNGFLWCQGCNLDYPSALCVPLDGESAFDKNGGPADAIRIYLDTVERAVRRAQEKGDLIAKAMDRLITHLDEDGTRASSEVELVAAANALATYRSTESAHNPEVLPENP